MKKLLLTFYLSAASYAVFCQTTFGLSTADVQTIQAHLDSSVNISLPNGQRASSKPEANPMLASFYTNASIQNFKILHRGASKGDDAQYFIASFDKNGQSYRLYTLYENTSNPKIKTLRISQ